RAVRRLRADGDGVPGAARARAAAARHPGHRDRVRARPRGAVQRFRKSTTVASSCELSEPKRAGGISIGELADTLRRAMALSFCARLIAAKFSTLKLAREIV